MRAGTGYTAMGPRPFVVLELDGTERTVWLHHDVLRNQFAREVHRRPDKMIHRGELVRIWQLEPARVAVQRGTLVHRLPGRVPRGAGVDADRHLRPAAGGVVGAAAGDRGAVGGGVPDDDDPVLSERRTISQGARATASPGTTQAEIFGPPGPSQAEIFGAPTRSTYGGQAAPGR